MLVVRIKLNLLNIRNEIWRRFQKVFCGIFPGRSGIKHWNQTCPSVTGSGDDWYNPFCGSVHIDPFHATGYFQYPLKTSENQKFSAVFRGYKQKPVA